MATERDLRVGLPVSFSYGTARIFGSITEDRGPIGVGGRRLYGIKFTPEFEEESYIELPAHEIRVEQHSVR